ncbi:MAG: translation initiation factor IF-3 [Parachlamydiaceae bacterium]|nr:translation initiation factor IF-3 [Parachlamydiaceae bacterium]
MKVNREIRAPKVRVITHTGEQAGIISLQEALAMAEEVGLDLVEVVPGSSPPVCKIMNFGKFRYDQSKREKESKKAQHQIKVKEIKLKPNIDIHDLETKTRHARDFLLEGNKVKITCTFRGREVMHPQIGEKIVREMCQALEDISILESSPKMMGRMLLVVLAPGAKKKKEGSKPSSPTEESVKAG